MSLEVTSLASGSSGNALLIQRDGIAILIDCGVSQRAIERQLRLVGVEPAGLTAIILTHEHGDHSYSAGPLARRWKLPVVCNGPTRAMLRDELDGVTVEELPERGRLQIGPFEINSFALRHDAAAPVGYLIDDGVHRVGIAIDLGSWDMHTAEALQPADLIVLEANHDRERLRASPYPRSLQHRIMGPLGHLDNVQAGELLTKVAADGRARDVWLAHLSEQANSPEIATRVVRTTVQMAGIASLRVAALPRKQSKRWSSDRMMVQTSLFGDEGLSV
jgi:Metal-dependent hydrolases of the beta-lactamase superfamily I